VPRWKFPYDADGVPSLDVRIQARGGPYTDLSGTVDSGASTTVLSIRNAEALGLDPQDLRSAPDAIVANKSRVHCWTAATPIRAQVLRRFPSDELLPWGPVFALNVLFIEEADPLWGQADFFATFAINFERPEFTLRY
jgi:hypothetical protein